MNDFPRPTGPDDDEQMRHLLDDAVSDVEPRDSLDSIHARTSGSPFQRKRPWLLGAGAAALATAATVAAVAVVGGGPGTTDAGAPGFAGPATESSSAAPTPAGKASAEPSTEPGEDATAEPSSPAAEPSASPADGPVELQTVPAYFLGDTSRGPRLYREFTRVRADRDAAVEAVNAAIGTRPRDPDYRSGWAGWGSATATEVTHSDGTITVDIAAEDIIRDRPEWMTVEEAEMAVEQLLYTVQGALQSRDPVRILVNDGLDGGPYDTVFGVPIGEPLAQGDAADVLAQVWIVEPADGAEVEPGSAFEVSGLAAAFEATVQWELKQGGKVVADGFTTAEECCTMAPYSFEVTAPPGEYTLVVHDTDPSGGEGFAPWEDTKRVTVLP